MAIYTNWATENVNELDGVVTPLNSEYDGSNPVELVVGDWRYSDDIQPERETGVNTAPLGYYVTGLNGSSPATYIRCVDPEPSGDRGGMRFWFFIPSIPAASTQIARVLPDGAGTVGALEVEGVGTNGGKLRVVVGATGQSASRSPVLSINTWYCAELIFDYDGNTAKLHVLDDAGDVFHTWEGTPTAAVPYAPTRYRFGLQSTNASGWTYFKFGDRISWGSTEDTYIGPRTPLAPPGPDPAPATGPVTHYNTAEGVTLYTPAPIGGVDAFEPTLGHPFDNRYGSKTATAIDTNAPHGTRGYRLNAGASESSYLNWSVSTKKLAARFYLYIPAAPSVTTRILDFRDDAGQAASVYLNGLNQIGIQAVGGSSQSLPGIPAFPATIRVELVADKDAGTLWGAWAYGDGGDEGEVLMSATAIGNNDNFTAVNFGKVHSTTWDASNVVLDDFALNTVAASRISAYAASYTIQPTVGGDIMGIEPGTTVQLIGYGTGTWEQVWLSAPPDSQPPPTSEELYLLVDVNPDGTFIAPPTVRDGLILGFDYGGAVQRVGVLRSTEFGIGSGGSRRPILMQSGETPIV